VHDQAIYRCINEACGRPAPRPVNYCPWCGTAQARAGAQAAPAFNAPPASPTASGAATTAAAAAAAAAAGASAAAALSGWSDAPPELPSAPAAAVPPPPAATPSASEFGRSGKPGPASAPPPPPPPRQEVPRPPLAAQPPKRSPIRLRWWILALALLWGLWLIAKPSSKKIERQIDAAIALARECKGSEAQADLIALRKTRASQEQLQRLQQALNDEAAKCTKRRQRGKAWSDASNAVESALGAASWDKARTRLQAFTRRWGEDEDTRVMKERIETARRDAAHPLAVPRSAVGSSGGGDTGSGGGRSAQAAAESARNLIQSAERDLDRGDVGAAIDKMTLCLTMVDAGNPECRALKTQAEQQSRLP
jgi:hypothetical protein